MRIDELRDDDLITITRTSQNDDDSPTTEVCSVFFADLLLQIKGAVEDELCRKYYMNRNNSSY